MQHRPALACIIITTTTIVIHHHYPIIHTALLFTVPHTLPVPHPRRYLKAAAQTSDPVERMKLVVTFFIAGWM